MKVKPRKDNHLFIHYAHTDSTINTRRNKFMSIFGLQISIQGRKKPRLPLLVRDAQVCQKLPRIAIDVVRQSFKTFY